jgi:hypothetical protein
MLVHLVNFEKCHNPIHSWLSLTGNVSRKFVTNDEWMQDLMHKFDLNNGFLTKFPEHKFFASTIVNQGQTYLAITVDSID